MNAEIATMQDRHNSIIGPRAKQCTGAPYLHNHSQK